MSDLPADLAAALAARFGEGFTTAAAARAQHAHGESHHRGPPPDGVVFARSTEEVAELLSLCAAFRVPVIPFGAGSSLEGHLIAVRGGISLDLTRMDAILRVSPGDLDCTVQAGVTRERLNADLRDQGLFFPIDPGADATLGGMTATRASGTNAVRYGTMRENVLALTVVLADGRIIRTGSRARKSSAGYDLTRLFVGSEGTLGVIAEITLRLHGIPSRISAALCSFPDVVQAVEAAMAIIQHGIPVARMELMDRGLIAAVNRHARLDLPLRDTLAFEFHGSPASVAEQVELAGGIVREFGGEDFAWAASPEERNRLWKARHQAYHAVVGQRPGAKGWTSDVCVPVSELAGSVLHARALLEGCPVPAAILGHVGDGNFHVVFAVDPDSPEEMEAVARINSSMVRRAVEVGGTCTGEHGVGLGKAAYLREEMGEAVEVMARLKKALDPEGILNPGKIFDL